MKIQKIMRKFKFSTKSQAATEFVMSYGWAILLVVVAIASVTIYGNPDLSNFFIRSKCKVYGTYDCVDFVIDGTNNEVVLVLRSTLGFNAYGVTASMQSDDCIGAMTTATVLPDPWINGQDVTITFDCAGTMKNNFEGNLELNWYTEDLNSKYTTKGLVKGKTK